MNTEHLIRELKASNLYAECPCGEEFKLSKAFLFDGTKPFPQEAIEVQEKLKDELEERQKELVKQRKLATQKALITTKAVNIGKNLKSIAYNERLQMDSPRLKVFGRPHRPHDFQRSLNRQSQFHKFH